MKQSRLKATTLPMDRKIVDLPSSIFHMEDYGNPIDPFTRQPDPELAVSAFDFERYYEKDNLLKSSLSKPLKPNEFERNN